MEPVKIHIPTELFEPAETQTFRGVAQLDEVTVGADEYRFSEPCTWVVEVTNTGGVLLLRGNVQAEGICACSRCLEDAPISFDGIIEGYLVISTEGCDDDLETDEFSRGSRYRPRSSHPAGIAPGRTRPTALSGGV